MSRRKGLYAPERIREKLTPIGLVLRRKLHAMRDILDGSKIVYEFLAERADEKDMVHGISVRKIQGDPGVSGCGMKEKNVRLSIERLELYSMIDVIPAVARKRAPEYRINRDWRTWRTWRKRDQATPAPPAPVDAVVPVVPVVPVELVEPVQQDGQVGQVLPENTLEKHPVSGTENPGSSDQDFYYLGY